MKSLICNGCVTQMLGVICQPGLSRRVWAALGGKELDTVLSLFTPTHNGRTCKYQPPHSPPPGSQLRCPAAYLDSGKTVCEGPVAGRGGGIGPIMLFSVLELEMMGCSLRVHLASLGSRGGTSVLPPFVPREGLLKKGKKKREGT